MPSVRSTFTIDEELLERARTLGVNVSAAARAGVASAVQAARAEMDRRIYELHPEDAADSWDEAEAWGDE